MLAMLGRSDVACPRLWRSCGLGGCLGRPPVVLAGQSATFWRLITLVRMAIRVAGQRARVLTWRIPRLRAFMPVLGVAEDVGPVALDADHGPTLGGRGLERRLGSLGVVELALGIVVEHE